jgi:hypothetical protein
VVAALPGERGGGLVAAGAELLPDDVVAAGALEVAAVALAGETAVEHPDHAREVPAVQIVSDLADDRLVRRVAGERPHRHRDPAARDRHPDHDSRQVGAMVPAVLGVCAPPALAEIIRSGVSGVSFTSASNGQAVADLEDADRRGRSGLARRPIGECPSPVAHRVGPRRRARRWGVRQETKGAPLDPCIARALQDPASRQYSHAAPDSDEGDDQSKLGRVCSAHEGPRGLLPSQALVEPVFAATDTVQNGGRLLLRSGPCPRPMVIRVRATQPLEAGYRDGAHRWVAVGR